MTDDPTTIEKRAECMSHLAWFAAFDGNEHLLVEPRRGKRAEYLALLDGAIEMLQELLATQTKVCEELAAEEAQP